MENYKNCLAATATTVYVLDYSHRGKDTGLWGKGEGSAGKLGKNNEQGTRKVEVGKTLNIQRSMFNEQ